MIEVFAWVERTGLSVWMRESLWAFPGALILHALGMAFLAGTGMAVALRVLGVARGAPMGLFAQFFPVMWIGFWMALVSGVLLLAAYPAKGLTNPVFGLKFVLLGGAVWLIRELAKRVFQRGNGRMGEGAPGWAKAMAAASLLMWAGAITAGRLLAYTHHMLLVT